MDLTTSPAARAGSFLPARRPPSWVGAVVSGEALFRNMVLLKNRKDQEREHKDTRDVQIWVAGQVRERERGKEKAVASKNIRGIGRVYFLGGKREFGICHLLITQKTFLADHNERNLKGHLICSSFILDGNMTL